MAETKMKRLALTWSEKKRRKSQSDRSRGATRVWLLEEIDRWRALKSERGFDHDWEVAKLLLDRYEATSVPFPGPSHSTPAVHDGAFSTPTIPSCSEIADDTEASGCEMSGVEEFSVETVVQQHEKSASFINPFDLTINITEQTVDEDDLDDLDYEPSIDITIGPQDVEHYPDTDEEDDEEAHEGWDDAELELGPGVPRLETVADAGKLTDDETCLVYVQQLLLLARTHVSDICLVCHQQVRMQTDFIASAAYIIWKCSNGHVAHRWCSQPVFKRRLHGGDLMLASAILISGNNMEKMALFAKHMKLHFLHRVTFHRMQTFYLVPAIEQCWDVHIAGIHNEVKGKKVVVMGDGRMDSPGHCAQYCTYTAMNMDTKKVLSIVTMDKRETEKKSTNMEKASFIKTMNWLENKVQVAEVVTDAHMQIGAVMKKQYPSVKHSHDIWHAAKNLGKKIIAAGNNKSCKELLQWSKDIVNHFWFSCEKASNYNEFLDIWAGVIHHVVGEHEWILPYAVDGRNCCYHDTMEECDMAYMKKGSDAHKALTKIALDKRFLGHVHYYLNFRSTANLEAYNQHILMYCSKRFSYSPPVYNARNLLAAIDHNSNVNRPIKKRKDGVERMQKHFNKKSGRWSVTPVREDKSYEFVKGIFEMIIALRIEDVRGIHGKVEMKPNDPRRLSSTIAAVEAPSTQILCGLQKSRFHKD